MKVFYCSTCLECYYIHPQEPATVCRWVVLFRCVLVYWCGSAGVGWYPNAGWNNTPTYSRRLLGMNVITFETCWAIKNFHKVTPSWFNLFNYVAYVLFIFKIVIPFFIWCFSSRFRTSKQYLAHHNLRNYGLGMKSAETGSNNTNVTQIVVLWLAMRRMTRVGPNVAISVSDVHVYPS
jgi:hypothetical protein